MQPKIGFRYRPALAKFCDGFYDGFSGISLLIASDFRRFDAQFSSSSAPFFLCDALSRLFPAEQLPGIVRRLKEISIKAFERVQLMLWRGF
ncbi:hypothetical protein [Sphingopyxis macrogoltabida]|uniref:hypothetical protein n=1 Tax=Sphingopyxis macrogoltabida TaxID=33050 RepID=UPI000AF70E47|nr:hypothetical protein [Sphingopyxis macrogoltabida]